MIEEEGKKMRCLFFREWRRVGGVAEAGGTPASCSGAEEMQVVQGWCRSLLPQ